MNSLRFPETAKIYKFLYKNMRSMNFSLLSLN